MAQGTSLFEMLKNILFDENERSAYQDDPGGYLAEHGYDELDHEDVNEAVTLMAETLPPDQVTQLSAGPAGAAAQVAPGSPLGSSVGGGSGGGGSAAGAGLGGFGVVAQAPPPPPHLPPVDQAVHTINYYVSNVTNVEDNDTSTVDDRDTTIDSSINQTILADGDVHQSFDNDTITASGDGAVAAGDDAEGVATGDGAIAAGDDIDGALNTGSFEGSQVGGDNDGDIQTVTGNVSGTVVGDVDDSDLNLGDNAIVGSDVGAASFGDGNAADFGEDNDIDNVALGDGDVTDVDAQNANLGGTQVVDQSVSTDNSTNDSFNQDNDATSTTTDSFNTDASTNDSFNTDLDTTATTTTEDSFNTDASTEFVDSGNVDATSSVSDSNDTAVDIDAELEQSQVQETAIDSHDVAEVAVVDVDDDFED